MERTEEIKILEKNIEEIQENGTINLNEKDTNNQLFEIFEKYGRKMFGISQRSQICVIESLKDKLEKLELVKEILPYCDHTFLKQTATWDDIKAVCDDAIKYGTASVCIPPCFVKQAKDYVGKKIKVCTVIGFPNGNTTTDTKRYETLDAASNGADEIDIVINVGKVKEKDYDYIIKELKEVKSVIFEIPMKVIIETCLLTKEEIVKMCEIVSDLKIDYIKTSTGFSNGGATFEDVELMKKHLKNGVKIKAAGGISNLEDAKKFLDLGVERLGTSRIVNIAKTVEIV